MLLSSQALPQLFLLSSPSLVFPLLCMACSHLSLGLRPRQMNRLISARWWWHLSPHPLPHQTISCAIGHKSPRTSRGDTSMVISPRGFQTMETRWKTTQNNPNQPPPGSCSLPLKRVAHRVTTLQHPQLLLSQAEDLCLAPNRCCQWHSHEMGRTDLQPHLRNPSHRRQNALRAA